MTRLSWGSRNERFFESGVDQGVLYVDSDLGVAWNGLISVTEKPSGGESRSFYLDGIKYASFSGLEEYNATINAYTYPDEFKECEGIARVRPGLLATQQRRKSFGLSYRSMIGNDVLSLDFGYKIHIVYNALATPSQRVFASVGSSINVADFSWDITTRPPVMSGYKRTSHLVIDTRYAAPGAVSEVEDILYGTNDTTPRLPTIDELIEVFNAYTEFMVTDNGDGTFTVIGLDSIITMIDSDTFQIDWPTAIFLDDDTFQLSSS